MAHSGRNKKNNLDCPVRCVETILNQFVKRGDRLVVGFSGGVDSMVLLDILVSASKRLSFKLFALHVNHGISPHASSWSHFCCCQCYAYGVPISVEYLNVKKEQGMSLEAVARENRYQIFKRQFADYLVLAQHRDDQAETLLLQLFRGSGVKGLSAMPVMRKQSSDTAPLILRPLLGVSRSAIEDYAKQRQLNWIHDESNDSRSFSRNFLRHEILPVLNQHYPGYAKVLQRTSQHMAEASQLLDELAEMDAKACVVSGELRISALRKLSHKRAKNLLRYMLHRDVAQLPSTAKLDDLLTQLFDAGKDALLHVTFGDTEIRCYQDIVYILPRRKQPPGYLQLEWHGESSMTLAALGGTLHFVSLRGQGISTSKLEQAPVYIKMRAGGERFTPNCKRPRRSLKNLMQEASVPPWERFALPLLFCGEQLVWVPGIGVDCAFQAAPGDMGVVPEWCIENSS